MRKDALCPLTTTALCDNQLFLVAKISKLFTRRAETINPLNPNIAGTINPLNPKKDQQFNLCWRNLYSQYYYLQITITHWYNPTSSPPLWTGNKYQGTFVPCHLHPQGKERTNSPAKRPTPTGQPHHSAKINSPNRPILTISLCAQPSLWPRGALLTEPAGSKPWAYPHRLHSDVIHPWHTAHL